MRVVAATTDPNPKHAGRGFRILRRTGIEVAHGPLQREASKLNEAFNHWIVHGTPFVTVKAGMTLDGKIATPTGESKWITGDQARAYGMKLRQGADAVLVGINTILADDPSLTFRARNAKRGMQNHTKRLLRIILDSHARTPSTAQVVSDEHAALTTVVVSRAAPKKRVAALAKRVKLWCAPSRNGRIDLPWLLKKLGNENVNSLLVEGGGEVNASFLLEGLAHRVTFFYAPKILGGRDARKSVAGAGARNWQELLRLHDVEWKRLGPDLLLTGRVEAL